MRPPSGLIASILLVALSSLLPPPGATPPPGPGLPAVPGGEPPAVVAATTPEGVGRAAASLWRKRHPELTEGRVALGWDSKAPGAEAVARGIASAEPAMRPLPDLGASADNLAQALSQISAETFSGLLWVQTSVDEGGKLTGIALVHRSTSDPVQTLMDIALDPFVPAPAPVPPPPSQVLPEALFALPGRVGAAAVDDSGTELWVILGGRLERRMSGAENPLQEWPATGGEDSAGPGFLRVFSGSDGERVGWGSGGSGVWLVRDKGEYHRGSAFEGFPLGDRESRFLKAPYLSGEGAFALMDRQGKELGRFKTLARARAEGGESLLLLLQEDGAIRAISGNTLEPVSTPAEGTFSAMVGWRDYLAVSEATAPHMLKIFRLTGAGDFEPSWISGPQGAPASALCLARSDGRICITAFVPSGEGTQVVRFRLP